MQPKLHIANLPKGWGKGVRITNFRGLEKYAGRDFILGGKFMHWSELETHSIRNLVTMFESQDLYLAFNPADPSGKAFVGKEAEKAYAKYPHAWREPAPYNPAASTAAEVSLAERQEALPSRPKSSDL